MKRIFLPTLILFAALPLMAGCGSNSKQAATKVFGTQPTLTQTVPITTLNAEPASYVNQDVLVAGEVVAMCMHQGCWVEVRGENGASIVCRSLDESIHFSPDCMNKKIHCQGKLIYDPNSPGFKEKQHEGEEPHLCPAPKVLVSLEGAVVDLATKAPSEK
ncbi:MAG: hypothetical protein PHI18_00265 [bacterium]|nr:hypothetical protein [bacterium]